MWCPNCASVQILRAVPAANITGRTQDHNQRWYRSDHPDIHWFQRGRQCLQCSHMFLTGEARLDMLEELAELRDALASVKRDAERYIAESGAAAKALGDLQQSLSVLRALKIYKQA